MTCRKKVKFIRIDGSTPAQTRGDLVNKFQQNSDVRVAILSINAAGTGLTLTVSAWLLRPAVKTMDGMVQALNSSTNQSSSQLNCLIAAACTCAQFTHSMPDNGQLSLLVIPAGFCDPRRFLKFASYLSASQAMSGVLAPCANKHDTHIA